MNDITKEMLQGFVNTFGDNKVSDVVGTLELTIEAILENERIGFMHEYEARLEARHEEFIKGWRNQNDITANSK